MNYPNKKNELYNKCQASIWALEEIWKEIVKAELQNEQYVLDWLDSINEISIRN